ncbi:4'-phosphopantetheinyl transferase superfamily protein [Pedobacter sp. MC2016-14]|uniref:4'-phosphopantetheinyl transferase family protein n=1 Tax=Pedobacter sp. MC2016-14 TaxID=2897327 RepID=UPI001E611B21|nr:4'-phosphopantetheinyl transferase superfamily protein [Pedobacter sp. MC2016-14]MCD0487024.1 4'-phosphopantetheinyl transferase superfamily protein [Pedobacter sp. MC2016-14]
MPVVFNKNIDNHTILSVWKIEESEELLLAGLQLKQHELDYLASLNNGKRMLHWLSTRLLLRTMLNTADYIDCRMDEHGKPYLVNSPLKISLSHSYDYAAVMIGQEDVGVDIEQVKTKIHRIQQKFLSPPELALPNVKDNTQGLYACWCAKEAVYKWYGKKGLEFKRDIHIQEFELSNEGYMQVLVDLPEGTKSLNVNYFNTIEGYMLGYVAG